MATRYAFFIHLRALPEWLRLPREQRRELGGAHLHALLPRYQEPCACATSMPRPSQRPAAT